jgi:glycosyltransferase involved in cell wall biosynthesis
MSTVMQVVLSLSPGGTERLVIEICRRLAGVTGSVVCCLDEAGEWAPELTELGIPVHVLGRQPGFHPSLAHRIARLARQHRADVLHCHHYSPFVYGVLASCLTRRLGVLFTEHGRLSDAAPSRKRQKVNPMIGRLPAGIYAVSEDLKRHMVAEGFPERRIEVVHNGIDAGVRPSREARAVVRADLGIPADALVVGTIGRLDPVKNFASLLDAHAAVRSQLHAHLVIVGDGPERPGLEALARSLDIAGSVHFVGFRSDARAILPACDLYVNSSTHEGISLTVLEAMAATLPVVATRVGGNPEVVMNGETGLLVPARSASHLALAIATLLDDPQRRRTMGEAARWRVKRYFTIERMVNRYLRGYERYGLGNRDGETPASADWSNASCVESAALSRSRTH